MRKPAVTEKEDIEERRDPEQPGRPQIFSDPDAGGENNSAHLAIPPIDQGGRPAMTLSEGGLAGPL